MNDSLSPKQRLVVLKLLFCEESPALSEMRPKLTKKQRDELESLGLIRLEPFPGKRRGKQIVLTDKAWGWASENLESNLSNSPAAAKVLQAVLFRLSRFLQSHSLTLADFYAPAHSQAASAAAPQPPSPGVSIPQSSVEERIRAIFPTLLKAETAVGDAARIADLKDALYDVPPAEIDEALLSMQEAREVSLQTIESMMQTTDRDRRAAINILGADRNIFYLVK